MSEISDALAEANSEETPEVTPEVTEEVETPSETPETTTETETTETTEVEETPVVAETETQELFELPDGRKVDGQTLAKEWKDNFLPDYTRKSQELAKISKPPETEQTPKGLDPEWQPESYDELLEVATKRVFDKLEADKQAEADKKTEVNSWVQTQLDEIKTDEPNLSEDLLFQHANKYGFGDLKSAFQNMKDFKLAVKSTEQKVLKNLKTREAEPIAAKPTVGDISDGIEYDIDRADSAADALARIKGV